MQDNSFYNTEDHRFDAQNQRRNSLQAQEDSLAGMVRPESLTRQDQILAREEFNYQDQGFNYDYNMRQNAMVPLNMAQNSHIDNYYKGHADSTANTKANIKQYIFSTIDNVLGGGQSSTAQIAQNMTAISNNLSNVACISQQYTQQYQQPVNQGLSGPTYFQSAPNTVRPEKPKLNMKYDMFGMNALEDDDQKNSLSPTLNKQQKLFDNGNVNNTTMISSNANISGDNLKAANMSKLLDQNLFSNIGISADHQQQQNVCYTQSHQQAQIGQANSKILFQNPVNYLEDEFQIKKMKSYNDAPNAVNMREANNFACSPNKIMSANGNDFDAQSKEVSTKKRSRKAYTKKTKKLEEEMQTKNAEIASSSEQRNSAEKYGGDATHSALVDKDYTSTSFRFAPDLEEVPCFNDDSLEANNDMTCTNDINVARLTNKKKQYLQDAIFDKNGAYSYLEDPIEYKKARKRLQNRESAVRSRQRKKSYQEELESLIDDQNMLIDELKKSKKELSEANKAFSSENQVLKQQVSYFQETFANSSLVGSIQQPAPQPIEMQGKFTKQEDLDQLKAELLNKLNRRFFENESKHKKSKSLDEDEHLIQPEKYEDMLLDKVSSNTKEPLDQLMADDYFEYPNDKTNTKRPRLHSGCIQKSTAASEGTTESHDQYVLKRDSSSSMHSKGFFSLAVVFGMMCASSIANNGGSDGTFKEPLPRQPTAVFSSGRLPKSIETPMVSSPKIEQRMNSLNLLASDVSDEPLSDKIIQKMYEQKQEREKKMTLQNTAHMMKNLGQLNTPNMRAGLQSDFLKTIMSGKYGYLTHLMCSTACFFFWMAPSAYKMRYLRPGKNFQAQPKRSQNPQNSNLDHAME